MFLKMIVSFWSVAALAQAQPCLAQEEPKIPMAPPSARDLYLGCSLLLRDNEVQKVRIDNQVVPYSAAACAGAALVGLGYSKSIKPGNEWEYCIPDNAATNTNPMRSMAATYVDFYEKLGFRDPRKQGLTMMLYSFKDAWPCR